MGSVSIARLCYFQPNPQLHATTLESCCITTKDCSHIVYLGELHTGLVGLPRLLAQFLT